MAKRKKKNKFYRKALGSNYTKAGLLSMVYVLGVATPSIVYRIRYSPEERIEIESVVEAQKLKLKSRRLQNNLEEITFREFDEDENSQE